MVHLNNSNGYWYLRRHTDDGKETIESFGKSETPPCLHLPEVYNERGEAVLKRLPDESVDCVITDPPYGIDLDTNLRGDTEYATNGRTLIDDDAGLSFLRRFADEFHRVLKPDSHIYMFTRWDAFPKMREQMIHRFQLNTAIAWDREVYSVGDTDTWSPGYEMIMHFEKGDPELYGKRPRNVIQMKPARYCESRQNIHPTQKPRALLEYLLEKSTRQGDLVVDPFGGSYATGRAAMRTFRRSVCAELDPEIHDAAKSLVKAELAEDPEYGIDWREVSGLNVTSTDIAEPERLDADGRAEA